MALAKLNLLHLLKALYADVRFTRAVYEEVVVEGMRRGHDDASTAHRFLTHEGWQPVVVEALPEDLTGVPLDRGELESIALAMTDGGLLLPVALLLRPDRRTTRYLDQSSSLSTVAARGAWPRALKGLPCAHSGPGSGWM